MIRVQASPFVFGSKIVLELAGCFIFQGVLCVKLFESKFMEQSAPHSLEKLEYRQGVRVANLIGRGDIKFRNILAKSCQTKRF